MSLVWLESKGNFNQIALKYTLLIERLKLIIPFNAIGGRSEEGGGRVMGGATDFYLDFFFLNKLHIFTFMKASADLGKKSQHHFYIIVGAPWCRTVHNIFNLALKVAEMLHTLISYCKEIILKEVICKWISLYMYYWF